MTNESCDTTEIPGAPPIINESLTNEHCSSFPVNRLSKSEKKALKAARLMERRKFHAEQYKNRRKVHNEELLKSKMKEFDGETFVSHCKGPLKSETAAKMDHALEFGLNVCIDLSFDVEHNERERISVAKQMSLAYGVVKKARAPLHLHLCSFVEGSTLSEKLHNQGCKNWKISFHDETSWNLFPVESLIILSPDAVEPLETLEPSKIYVIGGIVDRSVRKDRMHSKAVELGAQCRRFPIQELIPNRVNHVLNIDQCVSILQLVSGNGDWETSLKQVVPIRKQVLKGVN